MWSGNGLPSRPWQPSIAPMKRLICKLYLPALLLLSGSSLLFSQGAAAVAVSYKDITSISALNWQQTPAIASPGSPDALPGGSLVRSLIRFPDNLRRIGPQTPHNFSATLNSLQLPLMAQSADGEWIPMLASRWAASADGRRLFFELQENANWSDGVQVSTADIAFTVDFLSGWQTAADWQARQLQQLLSGTEIYSDRIFAFILKEPDSRQALTQLASLRPFARHAYENRKGWPENFDWFAEPTTGPYYISQINPGESIVLRRTTDWWASELPYFRYRFNTGRITLRLLTAADDELSLFSRGELSLVSLTTPEQWNLPRLIALTQEKKIQRLRFYQQVPAALNGLLLNGRSPLLKNRADRQAILTALGIPEVFAFYRQEGAQRLNGMLPGSDIRPAGIHAAGHLPPELSVSYTDVQDDELMQQLAANAARAGIKLRLKKIDTMSLQSKLAHGEYDLVWLRLSEALGTEGLLSLFDKERGQFYITNPGISPSLLSLPGNDARLAQEIEEELIKKQIFVPGYHFPFTQAAYWEWLHLPDLPGTRLTADLFDPADPVSGGLFWVNRRERASIMSGPERKKDQEAGTLINTYYRAADSRP